MIIGIGSDLIDIRRIEKSLERHGERFIARIYTDIEKARSERRKGAPRPMRNASPPRKPVPRRWAAESPTASTGATWAW